MKEQGTKITERIYLCVIKVELARRDKVHGKEQGGTDL